MVYCIIIDLNLRNCQMCVLFMRWKEQMKMCLCHWSVHRQWSEGQPDDWKSHGLGEEGEDCGHIKWSGKLNDAHCSMKYRYACKVTFLEWGKEVWDDHLSWKRTSWKYFAGLFCSLYVYIYTDAFNQRACEFWEFFSLGLKPMTLCAATLQCNAPVGVLMFCTKAKSRISCILLLWFLKEIKNDWNLFAISFLPVFLICSTHVSL